MGNKFYRVLVLFASDDTISRQNLIHLVKDEALVDEAIRKKYVTECGRTDIGDRRYRITELGKRVRNM